MVDGSVEIELSGSEALVLYEWLRRFNERTDAEFDDRSEQRVLWDLECGLEQLLLAPLQGDYAAALESARSDVRGGDA